MADAAQGSRLGTLAKQSLIYGIGSVVPKVAGLLLLPLYTHYLHPADYGRVELILSLVTLVSIVLNLGLTDSLFRFWFDTDDEAHRRAVFRSIFTWYLILSTVVCGAIALAPGPVAWVVLHQHGFHAKALIEIGALGLWINTNYTPLPALFRIEQRPKAFSVLTFCNFLATVTITIVLVTVVGMRASGLLLGNFLGSIVVYVGLLWVQRRWIGWNLGRGGRLMRDMLRFGLPFMPAGVALWGVTLVNRPIVAALDGAAALGILALGVKLTQAITVFVQAFQLSWPAFAFSIDSDDEARTTYASVLSAYFAFMGWVVLALGSLAPLIIHFMIHRHAFWPSIPTVLPLAIGQALYGSFFIVSIGTGRAKKTRSNWVISAIAVGVEIGLLFALVPHFGVRGAAWSVAGAYCSMFALMIRQSNKHFWVPWQWRRLAQVALIVAVLVVTASLVGSSGPAADAIRAAVVAAYPVVLLGTGFLTPRQITALRGRLRRRRTVAAT